MDNQDISIFRRRHSEVTWLLYNGEFDAALIKLNAMVDNAEEFTAEELRHLQYMQQKWQRAVDLQYHPPQRDIANVRPLEARYEYYSESQPHTAERALWEFLQHCSFGTAAFQDALSTLLRHALYQDNASLARHVAQLLLHHYAILNMVRYNPCMPVTYSEVSNVQSSEADVFPMYLPYWEAVEALETDSAQCWADILEITLENATPDSRKEYYYPKVLEALRGHYRKTNNFSRLEWIKAYEYE